MGDGRDLCDDARQIIDASRYLTLATADGGGMPWACPVWFAHDAYVVFLWVSRPGARHSRNIAARPEIGFVVFDSSVPPGAAQALYVDAVAEEVGDSEVESAIATYSARSEAQGIGLWRSADVVGSAQHRLYRARARSYSVLSGGDRRVAVDLTTTQRSQRETHKGEVMGTVISGISMSLDGFVAGPNVTREQQLGDGGDVLHRWLHAPDPRDSELMAEMGEHVGSILMGRRSYDLAEGDGGWGDGGPAGPMPCYVLTHKPPAPETVRAPSVFTFVTDGIHSAVEQAKEAAGNKVVGVHGASAAQQCLTAGLMDEIQVSLAPVLLGSGTRLFEHLGGRFQLERTNVIETPNATHIRFRVIR